MESFLTSKKFWVDTLERAIKTFAQFMVTLITVSAPAMDMALLSLNWGAMLLISLIGALFSVLTSVSSGALTTDDSASLVVETKEKL